jgi:hypothetical protein
MERIRDSELDMLRSAHKQQTDLLNDEIRKMQEFLDERAAELENLSKERNQMRVELET